MGCYYYVEGTCLSCYDGENGVISCRVLVATIVYPYNETVYTVLTTRATYPCMDHCPW